MTVKESADKKAILDQCDLFAKLDGKSLAGLAERAQFRRYSTGDVIFQAGQPGESMMVIAQGSVQISALAPTARDVILAELDQGDAFGEIALLDGRGRSADARALTNCKLLVLERRDLLAVMQSEPQLATILLELFCLRVRHSDERMMEFAFIQLPLRLARTLLSLSAGPDRATPRPLKRLSRSQSELADMVGGSRENVNRCLKNWKKRGLIDLQDGWIVLLDRGGLTAIAEMR